MHIIGQCRHHKDVKLVGHYGVKLTTYFDLKQPPSKTRVAIVKRNYICKTADLIGFGTAKSEIPIFE